MSLNINYKSSPPSSLTSGEYIKEQEQVLSSIKSELSDKKNYTYNLEGVDPSIDARKIFLFIETKRSNETA